MSERPENPLEEQEQWQGGWQSPRESSPWQSSEQMTEKVSWQQVKALPDDFEEEPEEPGQWHRPKDADTIFNEDDVVEVSNAPRMTTTSTPLVQRPEDIIEQITGKKLSSTGSMRPEDMALPTYGVAEEETVDSDAMSGDTLLVDEASQTMTGIEDDDEGLSVTELFALASLVQGDDDYSQVDSRDMSPAEKAILNRVEEIERELPKPQEESFEAGETQTLDDTSQQVGESAADYAARMAKQVSSGGAAQDFGYGQQATQATPAYTPEQVRLAQQFKETFRQVQVLRQMHEQGQIDRVELEARLQEHTIQDSQGDYWMIGFETNEWYRYNQMNQQWEVTSLPVPMEAASPRTETGAGADGPNILADSLPYLPDDGPSPVEYSSGYDDPSATQYTDAERAFSEQYGVEEPPIPRPDQPVVDPGQTMVGQSWDRTTQTYAEPTVPNMPPVDDYGATMPSQGYQDPQGYGQQDQYAYQGQQQDQYGYGQDQYGGIPQAGEQATGFEDYNAQASSDVYEEAVDTGKTSILTVLGIGAVVLVIFAIAGAILAGIFVMYQYDQIVTPYREAITSLDEQNFAFQTATILAADGNVITEIDSEEGSRIPVSIADGEVSPFFIHAVVSSEDPDFYENPGVSFPAIVRAFWQNFTSGDVVSGASTITQQIARERVISSRAENINEKLIEALVALEIADTYSKTEILNIYINEFPYGQRAFGVEAAANLYFDKSAAELDPFESALLAGILPEPSVANPITNRTQAFNNMNVVMNRMLETHCLTFEHAVDRAVWQQGGQPFCVDQNTLVANGEDFVAFFEPRSDDSMGGYAVLLRGQVEGKDYTIDSSNRSHFVDYVLGEIDKAYGRGSYIQRGFTIHTTLMPGLQAEAERALREGIAPLSTVGIRTGAVIVIDPRDGAIRAMVGSPDYLNTEIDGQSNLTLLPQQPGSAIKPVVYAAAMEGSEATNTYYSPAHVTWDVETVYNIAGSNYRPTNFDGRFRGPVPVRFALAQSLNVPAVRTYASLGVDATGYSARFVEVANALGIDFDYSDVVEFSPTIGLPTAIGATEVSLMDLTHAYATIANDGRRTELYSVLSITERDANGNELDVPLEGQLVRPEPEYAISPQNAYLLQDILSDDGARTANINGVPSSFPVNSQISGGVFGLPNRDYVAAKTGTNNVQLANGVGNPSRLWTVGFTNNFAVGVWVGTLDSGTPIGGAQRITGLTTAAPIWNRVMRTALTTDPGAFEAPGGIRQDVVCRLTGALSPDNVNNCPANQRVVEFYAENFPPPAPDAGFVKAVEVNSWTRETWSAACGDEQNKVTIGVSNINDISVLNYLNGRGQAILTQLGITPPLEPAPSQTCQPGTVLPTVRIMSPTSDVVVRDTINIAGQISADNMRDWYLSIAPQNSTEFERITEPRTDLVPTANSALGQWNSRSVENGFYVLRLEVYANDGGFIYRDVNIVVNNPPATPTPIPTETAVSPAAITPLPFPSPTPLGGG